MVHEEISPRDGSNEQQGDKPNPSAEAWTSASQNYVDAVQKLTQMATTDLVHEVAARLPFVASSRVLDNGCGSGSLTASICDAYPGTHILATDISQGMLDILAAENLPNVRTKVGDAMDLSTLADGEGADGRYSHVLSSFMIQFPAEPWKPIEEMSRVLQPGGILGIATWGLFDLAKVIQKVGLQIDPSIPFKLGMNEWPQEASPIQEYLIEVGFVDVKVWQIRMEIPQSDEVYIEYIFEGGNPIVDAFVEPWRDAGKLDLLKQEVLKTHNSSNKKLGNAALLAVARKP